MEFRIHGDNILECERTLELISKSINAKISYLDSPIYAPKYELINATNKLIFQLFPGYDKWGVKIQEILIEHGAPLREATDSVVTLLDGKEEIILFSIEFCNALPAGNNAWQRTGRAVGSASVNIPYLHIAEIGGIELDENRDSKAHRFPNPIIPFSYLTLSKNYNSIIAPVYLASPSSPKDIRETFNETFGMNDCLSLIRNLILDKDTKESMQNLNDKNLRLVSLLASNRKRNDTLKSSEWAELLRTKNNVEQLRWLEKKNITWSKKSSEKVSTSSTFKEFSKYVKGIGCLSVGAGDIPICLIPSSKRKLFSNKLKSLYNNKLDSNILSSIEKNNLPLIVVWVTGFKPRGDDSRPDRGLVPLARMLFGPDTEIMTVVYGPAKRRMIDLLRKSPETLAEQNGLWEAVLNLSNIVLSDSINNQPLLVRGSVAKKKNNQKIDFNTTTTLTQFGEQDVDSVIHALFAHSGNANIFECMCNPPGGDWSGLSYLDFENSTQYRWTSLPRVSKSNGKRPDHVIQINTKQGVLLLSIESKDLASKFDEKIGIRLNTYTSDLIKTAPNIRQYSGNDWEFTKIDWKPREKIEYISGGAFCYKNDTELDKSFQEGKLDLVLALEFNEKTENVILHLKSKSDIVTDVIKKSVSRFNDRLKIQVH